MVFCLYYIQSPWLCQEFRPFLSKESNFLPIFLKIHEIFIRKPLYFRIYCAIIVWKTA